MQSTVASWRYIVAGVTLVGGTALTWASLRLAPGDESFIALAALLAATWFVGAFATAGVPKFLEPNGRVRLAIGVGIGLCIASLIGGALIGFVPYIGDIVLEVLAHSHSSSLAVIALVTAVAGLAEELFFRGALYSVSTVSPPVVTTVAYCAVAAFSGNFMLVVAAGLVGSVTAYQRFLTGGVAVSAVTHVAWSMAMLFALPHLVAT